MKRTLVPLAAFALLIAGAALIARLKPGQGGAGQAGVAFIEREDGTFVPATQSRAAERTKPADDRVPTTHVARKSDPVKDAAGSRAPKGSDAPWLTEFALTERSGKLVSSQSFLGQPYVVGFFYATCPSICVRQNEKFKLLQDKFRGQPIRLIEITCDPEVDRPEVLAEYANRFGADPQQWLFFTGDMDYISRVGSEMYQIGVMRRGHPEKFALVDAQGKIYGYYTWSDAGQWQALQRDMAKLIAEQTK